VVGRDEAENNFLERLRTGRWCFEVPDVGSPLVLAQGEPDGELRRVIASLAARYSARRAETSVEVLATRDADCEICRVDPASEDLLERCRI
jgi:hypothetical protein